MTPTFFTLTKCPICGADLPDEPLKTVYSSPYIITEIGDIPLRMATWSGFIQCPECECYVQNPRQTESNYELFYTSGMYVNTLGIPMDIIKADEEKRAKRIAELALKVTRGAVKDHMDIGAGRGMLIKETKRLLGCKSNGFDVYGDFTDTPARKADLVTCIHVLEHVWDPIAMISVLRKLTKKFLILEVPIGENAFRMAHLTVFSRTALLDHLISAGYTIIMTMMDEGNITVVAGVENA